MGEVKGQGHIVHPVSNRCTSFLFNINRTNQSWDMANKVFDLEKIHPKFSKKIWQKKEFLTEFHQNLNRWLTWPGRYSNQVLKWLVEWFSLNPADKQIFINVTAMTLGQSHQKVIQYIFPDLYFLCPKYLRLAQTFLTWEAKVFAAAVTDADMAAETTWKHKVTPDWGDLINGFKYERQRIHWSAPHYRM